MVDRCYRKTHSSYDRYGGRGIEICERWLPNRTKKYQKQGFLNFIEDMGEKPSVKHSLDRINNSGNYEPENCKWSTASEQQKNKRKFKQPNNTGSRNKSSKLNEEQVAEIKYLLICTNKTQKDIASCYSVSQVCISLIKRHKKWAHVEPLNELSKIPLDTK
jgi:hypothetical protein